jgi:uncharacterized protein (TIGR02145 family)
MIINLLMYVLIFLGENMKHFTHFIFILFFGLILVFSNKVIAQTSSDIKIKKQIWMSKNLDISIFRNGDTIPEIKTKEDWKKAGINKQPAWCYYEFDESNGKQYGKLYNWYAVSDPRGLAPKGYRIPSVSDWNILSGWDYDVDDMDDEDEEDIIKTQTKLKSINGWNDGKNGMNSSGFNALPGGYCFDDGEFENLGKIARWWSSTEKSNHSSRYFYISSKNKNGFTSFSSKEYGYSVRCVKD